MKRFLIFLVAIAMIAGMSFAQGASQTRTLNLNVTVLPYVQLNLAYPATLDFGTISPLQLGPSSGEGFEARGAGFWEWFPEFAYANCPYSITLSGNNLAGDGVPVFARQEVGETRYDRLVTALTFHFTSDYAGSMHAMQYNSTFIYPNPGTWNITLNRPVPHTGEVFMKPRVGVRFPAMTPDFGVKNTWDQSPDAGLYEAQVTITIAVI
ncbi:MAG: hypothetical protein WCC06_12105 [Candidatus Aminicenantales bacterium]